jgi:hypothetical protein
LGEIAGNETTGTGNANQIVSKKQRYLMATTNDSRLLFP